MLAADANYMLATQRAAEDGEDDSASSTTTASKSLPLAIMVSDDTEG